MNYEKARQALARSCAGSFPPMHNGSVPRLSNFK